jgi:hypothetical protein
MISTLLTWPVIALALAMGTAAAEDAAVEVTTDTSAYCSQLHARVETMVQTSAVLPPQEVTDLTVEGQRMCNHGLARGGILRLRRALAIMAHPGEDQSGAH